MAESLFVTVVLCILILVIVSVIRVREAFLFRRARQEYRNKIQDMKPQFQEAYQRGYQEGVGSAGEAIKYYAKMCEGYMEQIQELKGESNDV